MWHFMTGYQDLFMIIIPVAVLHRIVHGLCQADKDIRIKIRIDIQPFDEPLDKVLNLSNATWI